MTEPSRWQAPTAIKSLGCCEQFGASKADAAQRPHSIHQVVWLLRGRFPLKCHGPAGQPTAFAKLFGCCEDGAGLVHFGVHLPTAFAKLFGCCEGGAWAGCILALANRVPRVPGPASVPNQTRAALCGSAKNRLSRLASGVKAFHRTGALASHPKLTQLVGQHDLQLVPGKLRQITALSFIIDNRVDALALSELGQG